MLQELDQRVLDIICDKVARKNGPGFIAWTLGKRYVAANVISRILKVSVEDIQAVLIRLVAEGYMSDKLISDDDRERMTTSDIALRHKAWLEYSHFDEKAILSEWGFDTLEDWMEWDGIDGSPVGGYGSGPFHIPLSVEIVRLPSKDYEVFWDNKKIWCEAYNDVSEIPRMVNRMARRSATIEEFVCRLVTHVSQSDMDFIHGIVEATRDGWKDSSTEWADILRWYWSEYDKAWNGEVDWSETDVDDALLKEVQRFLSQDH